MCLRNVGEDVGCTEIKTHEVELILKKKYVLDSCERCVPVAFAVNRWKKVKDSHGSQEWKNVSHNVRDSQSWTCEKCEKYSFLNLQMKTHIMDNHAEYWKITNL